MVSSEDNSVSGAAVANKKTKTVEKPHLVTNAEETEQTQVPGLKKRKKKKRKIVNDAENGNVSPMIE